MNAPTTPLAKEMVSVAVALKCRGHEAESQRLMAWADDADRRKLAMTLETRMILLSLKALTAGGRK